jgi:thiamine biosynthesis lipoprotein
MVKLHLPTFEQLVRERLIRVLLLLMGAGMGGCRQPTRVPVIQMLAGQTMGTTYSVKFFPTDAELNVSKIGKEIQAELDTVNQQMSTYVQDSELSRFNRYQESDWFSVSEPTARVVQLSLELWNKSDGAFDVTVGPLVNMWGFGPDGRPAELPSPEELSRVLTWTGSSLLETRLDPPGLRKKHGNVQVDLSAIAKGHGVDRVASVLEHNGIRDYFVEIGGEIRTQGNRLDGKAWQVGIERPDPSGRSIQLVLGLSGKSLATSGDYRNFFELQGERYSHTISPKTGRPVSDAIASASAIAADCATADGIATSMMSAGFEQGQLLAESNQWAVLLIQRSVGRAAGEDVFETYVSPAFHEIYPDILP